MLIRPDKTVIEALVRAALAEDMPWGDITSQALIPPEAQATATLCAREDGVLCGEDLFTTAMHLSGEGRIEFHVHDAEPFTRGAALATVHGNARAILAAERVALNFVQRLSGISTLTRRYVDAVQGTGARIVDTRKTTPGLRLIERYAVRCGGAHNHRTTLSDALMAKDNHLAILASQGSGDLAEALRRGFASLPHTVHKEVEVDCLEQIDAVLEAGADTILLDNFSLADMRAGVDRIRQSARPVLVEASGGVTLESVRAMAETGVDILSVGALTHSVRALDLGLDIG